MPACRRGGSSREGGAGQGRPGSRGPRRRRRPPRGEGGPCGPGPECAVPESPGSQRHRAAARAPPRSTPVRRAPTPCRRVPGASSRAAGNGLGPEMPGFEASRLFSGQHHGERIPSFGPDPVPCFELCPKIRPRCSLWRGTIRLECRARTCAGPQMPIPAPSPSSALKGVITAGGEYIAKHSGRRNSIHHGLHRHPQSPHQVSGVWNSCLADGRLLRSICTRVAMPF